MLEHLAVGVAVTSLLDAAGYPGPLTPGKPLAAVTERGGGRVVVGVRLIQPPVAVAPPSKLLTERGLPICSPEFAPGVLHGR
jgi:hypothetical protein